MLLIIHNLPANMTIASIKKLINENCGEQEVILDNLITEGHSKRVTVGLADETDAALLVRKINGLFLGGHQLFVEDVRQKKLADQPYRPQNIKVPKLPDSINQLIQFECSSSMQVPQMMVSSSYSNMPYYMTQVQNPYVKHDKATVVNPLPQVPFYQQDLSYGYQQQPDNQSRWIEKPAVSYPDKKLSLSNSAAKANGKNSRRDRKQDFSMGRRSNLREKRESPPRRGEDRRRRDKFDKRYKAPGPSRDARRSLSRERERYPRSRYTESNKSNRVNKIERSPPRDRRFNRDNDDRGRGSGGVRRDRAIKRNRDFNSCERVHSHEQDYEFGKPDYNAASRDNDNGNHNYDDDNRDYHAIDRDYDTNNCDYNNANRNIDQDEYDFQVNEEHSSFVMPENREERDDSAMYEQTYQEPDFELNRSYSEQIEINPATFSNNPYNSTFTNFNPDTHIENSTDFNAPPAKVPRFSNINVVQPGLIQPAKTVTNDDTFAKKSVKKPFVTSLKPGVNQHPNFYARAVAIIAAGVVKNAKVGFLKNYAKVNQHLKKCIESRIDVITQGKVHNTYREVIKCYRFKFGLADDPEFFKAVLEKTERGVEESEYPNSGDVSLNDDDNSFVHKKPGISANLQQQGFKKNNYLAGQGQYKFHANKMPKPIHKKKPNPTANVPVQLEPSKRLPRFPQGNKQLFKEQKKQSKMEYMVEDMYNLDPTLLEALNVELRNLCEVYLMACSEFSVDDVEEKARLILRKRTPYTFKKVIRIHLTKRLLNISDNLVIRIFAHPKNPKRDVLDQFLREMGITSVRKADTKRMMLAMAPSYEVYDELLAKQHFKIGDCTLQFKPLHLTGPPIKKKLFKNNKKATEEEDNEECGDDEELERLIEETENKVIRETENVNVAATDNGTQVAGNVVEVFDDYEEVINDLYSSFDEIGPSGPHAEADVSNDDNKIDVDVVKDKNNDAKEEIKDEEANEISLDTNAIENNDKATVDNSKAQVNIKSDDDAKENTEIINKEADDKEKGNEINNKSDKGTNADSAELDEDNLGAVEVDDDDLEDF